jgi:hypothetical protein
MRRAQAFFDVADVQYWPHVREGQDALSERAVLVREFIVDIRHPPILG